MKKTKPSFGAKKSSSSSSSADASPGHELNTKNIWSERLKFFLTFQSGITIFDNFNLFLQAIRDQCLFFIWGQSRARSTWIIKPSNVTLKPKIYCNTLLITLKWLNIVDSAEEDIWKIENYESPKKLYNIDHRLAGWIAEQSKRLLPRHISQL